MKGQIAVSRRGVLTFGAVGLLAGRASLPVAALGQAAPTLKIATIGAGREGGALGSLFAKSGHPVMFSSRNPDQLKDLVASAGPNATAGTVAEAVAFGDVVLLVVPYPALEQIARDFGTQLAAKPLVLDVSNPIARRDGEDFVKTVTEAGGPGLFAARLLPGAHLVRGFNAIGSGTLAANAHRAGTPLGVPIAGDDAAAVTLAETLIRELGFEPVPIGGLAMGRYLVPGTPLGGEHTPDDIRQIMAKLG